jgi:hypothetical protein
MTDPMAPRVLAIEPERFADSTHEAANLLGVDYFSLYRLIQRGKLRRLSRTSGKVARSARGIVATSEELIRQAAILKLTRCAWARL